MNQINFELEMQKTLQKIKELGLKPKLLLHACCAPCASSVVERLKEFFELTLYFYNSNMDSKEEFLLRAKEVIKLAEHFSVEYIIEDYDNLSFLEQTKGFENESEGGARCVKCFNLRLEKTAKVAKAKEYEYFASTLTVSPLKNARLINGIGQKIAGAQAVKYLPSDFKKKNGYIRSIELSRELDLYRQNYCGCVFSKR